MYYLCFIFTGVEAYLSKYNMELNNNHNSKNTISQNPSFAI